MFDAKIIKEAVNQTMPFGKYAGRKLLHLPEPYLVWFHQKGFPSGKLGEQLALMYEVKLNGLESMLAPLLDDQEKLINQYCNGQLFLDTLLGTFH